MNKNFVFQNIRWLFFSTIVFSFATQIPLENPLCRQGRPDNAQNAQVPLNPPEGTESRTALNPSEIRFNQTVERFKQSTQNAQALVDRIRPRIECFIKTGRLEIPEAEKKDSHTPQK